MEFPIYDLSNWRRDYELNASGTREKYWLIHPRTSERYLFKLPREGTGEVWAEKVASEIGKMLGLEMMDVFFAIHNRRTGVLLKKFQTAKEEFFDGGDLLKAVIDQFDSQNLQGYNLENIIQCLKPLGLEKEFIKMIIFDTVIANQDRHCENWGIIKGIN